MPESEPSLVSSFKDVLASIVGSAACVYTGQPFDTIKVRMQVQPGFFLSPMAAIRTTINGEGVLALWRGAVPAFAGALGENAMAFGVNGFLKRSLYMWKPSNVKDDPSKKSYAESFATGAITGLFIPLVLCPCDVLKCRAQMSRASGRETSTRRVIADTFKSQGFLGFYSGFQIQIIRDVIFYSSFFGTYDGVTWLLKKYTPMSEPVIIFTAGGLAGQVAWILSIASDTIKSRIQASDNLIAPNIRNTFKDIISTQGYKGLFRGIEVAVIRAFPANAALFMGYELSRKGLDKIIDN